MHFTMQEMTEDAAAAIAAWTYPPPYDFYSFQDTAAEREELLNGLHFAAVSEFAGETPCGFIAIGWSAQIQDRDPELRAIYNDETYTDIALGLRPDLCGRGLGESFLTCAIAFVRSLFDEDGIRLTVAAENQRACRLYERCGFREIHTFDTAISGRKMRMKIMKL